jgi:hypothetical protein
MAQTGFTPILIYSSSTATNAPAVGNLTNSTLGSELAINITDGKLFYKDNSNVIQVIAWKVTPTTAGGTGLTSYTAGDLLYYATGTTLSKLAIGTAYYMLGVNSGATAPSWQPSATSVLTTQGDLLYASAANTLARLAKSTTATRYLANTGTNNNPAWAQIDVTNGVTGTLPTGNGGTGVASYTAGDLIYYASGTAFTKLGIGAANTVLTSSGSAPQWSTALTLSGNVTAAAFIPSAATIPSNGLFLPAANTVGLATNSTEAWRVDSSQRMMIGTASQNGLLTVAGKTSTGAAATVGNVALDNTQILVTPSGGVFGLDPVCSISQFQSNGAAASIVLTLNRHVGQIYIGATWSGSGSSTLGGVIFVASNDSGISASIVSQTNFSGLGNFTISTSGKDLTISMPSAATCYISGCFIGTTVA